MRWCCAACGPRRESGDCWCGERLMKLTPNVSHFLDLGQSKREFHKELIHNFMEPRAVYSNSIHQVRAPPPQWAELEVPLEAAVRNGDVFLADDREANKAWIGWNCSISRRNCCKTSIPGHLRPGLQELDVCTLLLTKSGSSWLDTGWVLRGWGHSSCLPVPTGQIQVLPGLGRGRRCCKVGHSCMRRVIDCSSVPHKMAWRSVARSIRMVARLGGRGCEIFVVSPLRFELDSVIEELDTPPSRCCWRCGCAMSCVSLITADIDQAFGACSSSAVLPARRRISQTYESRFSSNSILVRRGRRELCKLGSSQSFGRGWLSFTTSVLARALFSFTSVSLVMLGSMVWQIRGIPIGGVMSSAALGCRVRCCGAWVVRAT